MKEVAAQRQQEEEAFYRQQELMIDAENQRRAMIGQEEQKLVDQRSRFVQKNEWLETSTYLEGAYLLYRISYICRLWVRFFGKIQDLILSTLCIGKTFH